MSGTQLALINGLTDQTVRSTRAHVNDSTAVKAGLLFCVGCTRTYRSYLLDVNRETLAVEGRVRVPFEVDTSPLLQGDQPILHRVFLGEDYRSFYYEVRTHAQ